MKRSLSEKHSLKHRNVFLATTCRRVEKTDAELLNEMLECARTGEDKRFRKLYRKLSNKDIPPARTGCGMSFKEKNKSRRKSCNGKLLPLDKPRSI